MAPKKYVRRRPKFQKKRKTFRRRGRAANRIGGPNTAKIVEVMNTIPIALNTPYQFVKSGITGTRAPTEASIYGLYRIAKISYTYRPLFDTYSSSLPGTGNAPNAVPTLYWKMNRYGDAPPLFDGNYMRAMGSRPNRLDDKQITVSYRPNTLNVSQDAAAAQNASGVKMTPWLSTDERPQDNVFNISTAQHYGHLLFVEGGGAGNAQGPCAFMDIKVVYEFKNPRVPASQAITVSPESVGAFQRMLL